MFGNLRNTSSKGFYGIPLSAFTKESSLFVAHWSARKPVEVSPSKDSLSQGRCWNPISIYGSHYSFCHQTWMVEKSSSFYSLERIHGVKKCAPKAWIILWRDESRGWLIWPFTVPSLWWKLLSWETITKIPDLDGDFSLHKYIKKKKYRASYKWQNFSPKSNHHAQIPSLMSAPQIKSKHCLRIRNGKLALGDWLANWGGFFLFFWLPLVMLL